MKKNQEPKHTAAASQSNARVIGFLLLIPTVLCLVGGIFMCLSTLGTNLLYVTASRGALYRQYPVFLIAGAVLCIIALVVIRRNPAIKKESTASAEQQAEEASVSENAVAESESVQENDAPKEETVQKEVPAAEVPKCFCQKCGAEIAPDDRFCLKCGTPAVREEEQA